MYFFGPFSVDSARRVLLRDAQPVPITARAFDVLIALLERPGETVEREELLRTVWPDTIVEEANLSQQIFTLRKLLGQTEEQPYIATVPRRGYRLVVPITRRPQVASAGRGTRSLPQPPPLPVCLDITVGHSALPADAPSSVVAISPDGARIVYVGAAGDSTRLYLRPLGGFGVLPLEGTEGASNPFFSPDGQWIGFQVERRLCKLALAGGPAFAICEVADLRGAAWMPDGDIVYAPGPTTGLWRVSSVGGAAAPATTLDFGGGERTHRWPHALPDGRVIFTIGSAGATSFDDACLAVTDGGEHRLVLRHATDGRWLPGGALIWARGAALFAAAFDLAGGRVEGAAHVVQHGVAVSATGVAHAACSDNGVFVHVPGEAQTLRRSLVSVSRKGVKTASHAAGDSLEEPRLAPDGASAIVSLRRRTSDLWQYDFARGALGRLTFEGENFAAIWGPDAGTITFSSSHGAASDLFLLRPDRSAAPELLLSSEFDKVAGAWSPDGETLVFTEYHPESGADLWLLHRPSGRVEPFVRTRFNEYAAVLSPDGRHVAYVTDESGRPEVLVVSNPGATGKRQLSTEGGTEPMWSRDGSELFYRSGRRLMRIDVRRGVEHAGIPTTLFEGRYVAGTVTLANYDVATDAAGFLMVTADAAAPPSALHVTVGWHPLPQPR